MRLRTLLVVLDSSVQNFVKSFFSSTVSSRLQLSNYQTSIRDDKHDMSGNDLVLLAVAALFGGGINAIAGGGMLVGFPALISSGMSPLMANAPSTVALLPGSAAAGVGYPHQMRDGRAGALHA